MKIDISKVNPRKAALLLALAFFFIFSMAINGKVKDLDEKVSSISSIHENDPRIEFYRSFVPLRKWREETISITSRAAGVILIDSQGERKFLLEERVDAKLPIASITKLMTALIILEDYNLEEIVVITEEAYLQDFLRPDAFRIGEQFKVNDLLHSLLLESSNTAAYALAQRKATLSEYHEPVSIAPFVNSMNQKARDLGMTNTHFVNPTGLDPLGGSTANYSTIRDLALLTEYLLDKPLIWQILSLSEFELREWDGSFKHIAVNTNALINSIPGAIGGKTGRTSRAGECLLFVVDKGESGYLISIVLGSTNRFEDMENILEWIKKAYYWEKI